MKLFAGVVLVTCILSATAASAANFYVIKGNPYAIPPYNTWETAARSIQAAIGRAEAGDTVWVSGGNGTLAYTGSNADPEGGENVVVLTKNVSVMGVGNPVIDGQAAVRGAYISAGLLHGFTIRNGAQYRCNGVYVRGGRLMNSVVTENSPGGLGYGLQLHASGQAINCLVTRNRTGVYFTGGTLVNCTVAGNYGKGLYMYQYASVYNCISWANGGDNWFAQPGEANSVSYFYNNCTQPLYSGPGAANGNIAGDPNFQNPPAGNYRIDLSSCVNGGWASGGLEIGATDLDGTPRVEQGRVDIGAYEWRLPEGPAADVYEPDDSQAAAKAIVQGEPQGHSLPASDVDWVRFSVPAAGARDVQIETAGGSGDTYVWLHDGSGGVLQIDDDSGAGQFSRITVPVLPAGTYYVRVEAFDVVEAYTLSVSWTAAGAGGDMYEPDNAASAAKRIANGQTQIRSIHAAGNRDWAKFTIGSGGAADIRIVTAGVSGDTQIFLFGPNSSTRLVYSDDDSGDGAFSRIALAALPAGTYYILVTEFNNDGTIPAYTLKASWTALGGPARDTYERDNSSGAAKTIANGQLQRRTIHVAGNKDWAKFTVGGAGAANVRVETAGTVGDTVLRLYAQNSTRTGAGALLASNNNGGVGAFSRIRMASLPPGTYYIRVTENGNNGTIPAYTLKATWTSLTY